MPNLPTAKLMDTVVGIDVHVVAAAIRRAGLTAMGAEEVLQRMPVTSTADRRIVAGIVAMASTRAVASLQMREEFMSDVQFRRTTPHVWFMARQKLAQIGISPHGIHQVLTEQPVTDSTDRKILTAVVVHAASGFGMHFWPRVGEEVIVG